ncbi:helix-turn-helix domain-containing protein [Streptomyces sp. VRA16 Mangrove soil]|uniref:nSTAND1 domain-containing NTPase n=1 Tax=Streptomyces sp. VRA16 Mangrove soil TaxID=2817434 RepID=UPI001A9ECAE8|nr:helix-turn-helix domain-containing protein [Streptomyces sp. VRA16 Mangrove soil]MBO1332612.1 helix-turn-helix domain-containing protein [Streptomyces sp. VRA16 Mangrove soil]
MGRHEKPLDPRQSPVARLAADLRRLRREAGGPTYASMVHRAGYSVATLSRAAAGEQFPSLPVVRAYATACGAAPGEWEERWYAVSQELTAREQGDNAPSPYRGLARFEPGDEDLFFGRDALGAELLDLTRAHRVVALLGPSGSGKSSLLRAGLIPRLQRAVRSGEHGAAARPAAIRVLAPGAHPLDRYRSALVPATGDGETWVVVDQFEELFTLCPRPAEREEFIAALLAARDPGSCLRVVLGIRTDFARRCHQYSGLAEVMRGASLTVTRMSTAELRETVVGPARAHNLIVERALTARLIADVTESGSALPLLSHALLETWKRRSGRTLTLDSYERAGGLQGAIAQSAEGVYARFDATRADTARRILLRLITPGTDDTPDTRRSATRAELEALSGVPGADGVLEALTRAGLITLDGAGVYLTHEALISAWPRLGHWIEENREKLHFQRWLTEAAEAWEAIGRERGVRISPIRLAHLAAHVSDAEQDDITPLEADFLAAGMATHRRTRRNRLATRAMGSLLVATTLLTAAMARKQRRLLRGLY